LIDDGMGRYLVVWGKRLIGRLFGRPSSASLTCLPNGFRISTSVTVDLLNHSFRQAKTSSNPSG
jgi:hypothetical protein